MIATDQDVRIHAAGHHHSGSHLETPAERCHHHRADQAMSVMFQTDHHTRTIRHCRRAHFNTTVRQAQVWIVIFGLDLRHLTAHHIHPVIIDLDLRHNIHP